MAYTSVIPVRRLDRAVKYVMNKEKTTAVSLQDALDYAANRDKTEQSCFESSYACTLETAFADMRQTKERWHKLGGVQGYHLVQSFAAGEVSPELAHQIAKELADRVLGGRYEYVIGTHLNTGHIHSHIVWNSVSRIDGKKYHSNGKRYVTQIRAVSDELCRKYKLSVIDTENSNHVAKPYAEWLAEKNGQPTWRTAIRQDVDEAIQQSLTCFQLSDCLIAAEGIGHLRHGGAGHNNSGHTLLAQSILDGNGVHHGCQHTDLVCIHAIHFAGGTAAPEIAAANHDADLCAKVIRCLDARADRSNGSFIKTGAFFAGKCFAGDFQKNTFILNCHIQTPPVFSGHSRRCRGFPKLHPYYLFPCILQ